MNYFISASIVTLAIPAIGIIIQLINNCIFNILSKFLGNRAAMFIVNWLTFPGVIHHELSHALMAFISGAKINGIQLFRPNGKTLGNVKFTPRGNIMIRSIQCMLTAIGPVICGIITIIALFNLWDKSWSKSSIILLYLMFAVIIHADMSKQDTKIMFKGAWFIIIVLFLAFKILNIDLIRIFNII